VSFLDQMSYVAAVGNVGSMLMVGPMLLLVMRWLGAPRRVQLAVAVVGWAFLFTAQIVMWQVFGFHAGYLGFRDIQWLALPISAGNLAASLMLTRQSSKLPVTTTEGRS
jgi:hypothetical protein